MKYQEALEKIKSYSSVYDINGRLEEPESGSSRLQGYYFAVAKMRKEKVIPWHYPEGCREMFCSAMIDYKKKSDTVQLVHLQIDHFKEKNRDISLSKSLEKIQRIESVLGNKTVIIPDPTIRVIKFNRWMGGRYRVEPVSQFRALIVVPAEWFYCTPLASAYLLLLRDPENVILEDEDKLKLILAHRKYIFDEHTVFMHSSRAGLHFLLKGEIYYSPNDQKERKVCLDRIKNLEKKI